MGLIISKPHLDTFLESTEEPQGMAFIYSLGGSLSYFLLGRGATDGTDGSAFSQIAFTGLESHLL
jgi:hypothetical protein